MGEHCTAGSDASKNSDPLQSRAICEARVRTFQLARTLQKAARGTEGWQLFAPLQRGVRADRAAPGISLGREEGVQIGYAFRSLDPDGSTGALFKVVGVGPGGEPGIRDPSELNLRLGEARPGAKLLEYPLLGLSVQPYFGGVALLQMAGTSRFQTATGLSDYTPTAALIGGGAGIGYDLSPSIGWVETHLRTFVGYMRGQNEGIDTALVPIDLLFEKGFYLGPVLSMYLSAGGTGTYVRHEVKANEFGGTAQSLSAWVYGLEARLGYDLLLSSDLGVRVEAVARVHFSPAEYTTDDDTPVANGFDQREDKFSMLGANLALNWML